MVEVVAGEPLLPPPLRLPGSEGVPMDGVGSGREEKEVEWNDEGVLAVEAERGVRLLLAPLVDEGAVAMPLPLPPPPPAALMHPLPPFAAAADANRPGRMVTVPKYGTTTRVGPVGAMHSPSSPMQSRNMPSVRAAWSCMFSRRGPPVPLLLLLLPPLPPLPPRV